MKRKTLNFKGERDAISPYFSEKDHFDFKNSNTCAKMTIVVRINQKFIQQ